jgi:NRPS condensation-like uncharacterized protein
MKMSTSIVLETTGQDWANHISRESDGNGVICTYVYMTGCPDAETLCKAVQDSITLQPVLGCRFEEACEPPKWVPVSGNDGLFTVTDADSLSDTPEEFIHEEMEGRQLAVRLIRCPDQSALIIKLDHSCIDGGGAKAYLALLNRLYNLRLSNATLPETISQNRSDRQVFSALNIPDFRMALRRKSETAAPVLSVPFHGTAGIRFRFACESFPLSCVKRIPGTTVNDVLLTACARALSAGGQTTQIHLTIDLRRYLEEGKAPIACNLSGIEAIVFDGINEELFEDTVKKTGLITKAMKENQPGLFSAASMAYLNSMPYWKAKSFLLDAGQKARNSGTAAPLLSNLGMLFAGEMRFGDVPVTKILPVTPAMHAPAFMLGAGSYLDTFTLSAAFYEEERSCEEVNSFLKKVWQAMTQESDGYA